MVTDFCEIFKNTIRGKYDRKKSSRVTKDLSGGATIKSYFNNLLSEYAGNYKATEKYSNEDIQKAMASHEGDNIPGFPGVDVFIFLLQPQLEKLRDPVLDCLANVHSYLEQLAHKLIERIFYRFPSLSSEIADIASQVLYKEREECREIVEKMIDSEETYVFTNDIDYLTARTDIIPKSDGKPKSSETMFVDEIRSRIDSYFRVVIRSVRDSIPKTIGTFLVRSVMDKMQMELYERINMTESILSKLSEPPHITAERDMLKNQLSTLRKAEKIMKHDPALAMEAESVEEEIRKQEEELRQAADEKKRREEEKKKKEEDKNRKEDHDAQEKQRKANVEAPKSSEESKAADLQAPSKPENRPSASNSLFGDPKPRKSEKSLF